MRPPADVTSPARRRGVVLYDGACRFCRRWVLFWAPVLLRNGFDVDTLQAPWVSEALQRSSDELLADIRLLTADGKLISAADVYLTVTRSIWWARPFSALFSLPGLNSLIHIGYRWFSRNRYCVAGKSS